MSQKRQKLRRKLTLVREMVQERDNLFGNKLSIGQTLRDNWIFLMMISAAIVILFANAMNAAFVSDDYATLLNNPEIATWKYAFQNGGTAYIMNSLTAMVFGVSPLPYHLASLGLYLISVFLAFIFVHHLFGKSIARLTTCLFVVHPLHVEAVSWISGKPYLLIAIYVLLALILFIKFVETENIWYLVGTGVSFILGFLTDNPRPFSLFLIIPMYLWLGKIDIRKNKWVRFWPILLVMGAIVMVVAWPNIQSRIGAVNSGTNASDSIFYNPFFQYPTGFSKYLQMMLVPVDLTLYHTMFTFPVWLNWAILLMYLGLVIYFAWVDRRYSFVLLFIFAAILPSMMPVKVSWLVAERYGYLGSLGFCVFLALIIYELTNLFKPLAAGVLIAIMVLFCVRVIFRNIDWQTNHNLWVNTCQVSPNSHNAWNNIGDDYDKLKQYDNAVKGFTQSTIVKPNYADAFHNRANILFKIGRLDLARDSYNTAIYFNPGLYQTYLSLINIDMMEKKLDLALDHANAAIKVQPGDPTTYYVLAVVYSQRNEVDKAIDILEKIVRSYPGYRQASEALVQLKSASAKAK